MQIRPPRSIAEWFCFIIICTDFIQRSQYEVGVLVFSNYPHPPLAIQRESTILLGIIRYKNYNLMINLEEQKEKVAKQSCLYVADLIEGGSVKMLEAAKLLHFLVTGVEGAENEDDLKKLPVEVKQMWPTFSVFNLEF